MSVRSTPLISRPARNRPTRSRHIAGYTVVELVMALGIFAIGVTGILAFQIYASRANTTAKDIATATALARSWQDKLAVDALTWGGPTERNISTTRWLREADTAQENVWHLPVNDTDADPAFGPGADARGGFVDYSTDEAGVVFCTHIRLTRLLTTPNAQMVRSEVRVFWPKGKVAWDDNGVYCDAGSAVGIGAATDMFNFVYHTSVIRETSNF